ncbi:MAG: helix-turn-helix transcriptional regulator [Gemmatimonadetes bacterium]|nr:helix-turn-helix transcriptional regulator [Gemmatimonadota bacterium]
MSTPTSVFSDNLKKIREIKGLSQAELAKRAGLQPSAVSHFETGRRAPSFDNLKRLADTLEVTTDFLIGRDIDPTTSGPTLQSIFRNAQEMADEDRQQLAEFAAFLANKKRS